jgi:hypothetical protein
VVSFELENGKKGKERQHMEKITIINLVILKHMNHQFCSWGRQEFQKIFVCRRCGGRT